ncbi:hypothetical protein GM3709_3207 [Geminocystis sp. NIES-3709]|nr:hypothetical protein GM3709_3207 [Geminocystis sp. NIES-3709]
MCFVLFGFLIYLFGVLSFAFSMSGNPFLGLIFLLIPFIILIFSLKAVINL